MISEHTDLSKDTSCCWNCGTQVISCAAETRKTNHPFRPTDILLDSEIHKVPFYCEICGAIKKFIHPLRDLVFIWPLPCPTHHGEDQLIEIPEVCRQFYLPYDGILIGFGKGYHDKKGRFWPTSPSLKIGLRVVYDKNVLWEYQHRGTDGQMYVIKYMSAVDIKGVLD
ncbi:MAG: hypothetical protein WC346_12870 [Methanogenium sp.]|jgi:hypothetical protein